MTFYRGLTWDHPRGYQALLAGARKMRSRDFEIQWQTQPLEGFESASIQDLTRRFDLIVIDHPHVGEAVQADCLQPLEQVFDGAFVKRLEQEAIGPTFSSYAHAGKYWALPLDAAAQVMAARQDLLEEPLPTTWAAVETLARRRPIALSLAGPHAIITFMSICVALGRPPADPDPAQFIDTDVGLEAMEILSAIYAQATRAALALNPIGLLERMTLSDDIALCPLVYGYVNYAKADADHPRALVFSNAPTIAPGGRPGSTLGGTGIAVTKRCDLTPALATHLEWLMSPETQEAFIPFEAGQPGLRSAWASDTAKAACGNFFRDTARTLEAAWVRPRHPGYIEFQTEASAIVRAALETRAKPEATLAKLQERYARSCTSKTK